MKTSIRRQKPAAPVNTPSSTSLERGEHPSIPNSTRLEEARPLRADLDAQFQARMQAHFPDVPDTAGLSKGSGRALHLPEALQDSLEGQFGYSIDNLKFRESSDVNTIGAKAYARGDEIHFAPGQFRPDTALGRKMIGHEVAHIAQQAAGGLGTGVQLDPAMEHQADVQGDQIAGLTAAPAHQSAALAPMPTASFDSAPAQGWGISIFHRKGKGEHERLTESARRKVVGHITNAMDPNKPPAPEAYMLAEATGALDNPTEKKSLDYGARFNDVGHHSALGMAWQMEARKKDAFINQTHHGDMQFLHAMDTSGGDTQANVNKMRRYAQFTSDVYQNRVVDQRTGQLFQDQNMLDYVMSQNGAGDPLQEMMLTTMVDPKALKKFNKQADPNQDRMAQLRQYLTFNEGAEEQAARAKYQQKGRMGRFFAGSEEKYVQKRLAKKRREVENRKSKYAKGTIGNFFTNGNQELDAGAVALGSASHMLEDSFAGSHAIRADNLVVGTQPDTELSETGQAVADKSTPILVNADYNVQDNNPLWGRHGKGDKFVQGDQGDNTESLIQNTQGASLARDTAAQFMLMNVLMKQRGGQYAGSDLEQFIANVTKTDDKMGTYGQGAHATKAGRAYDKAYKGSMSSAVKKAQKAYRQSTAKSIVGNEIPTADKRAVDFAPQIESLKTILESTHKKDAGAQAHYRPHAYEMLSNIEHMLDQLPADQQNSTKLMLQAQRSRLREILGIQ